MEIAAYTGDSQQYSGQNHSSNCVVLAYMETASPRFLLDLLHLRLPPGYQSSMEN